MSSEKTMSKKPWVLWAIVIAIPIVAVLFWSQLPRVRPAPERVERVVEANPELQKAAQTAQDQIKDFIDRLQSRREGERFAIRGRFETPSGPEYLWVKDPVYSEGSFTGTLDQQPMILDLEKGMSVTVEEANVYDWMIQTPKGVEGGFTEKALRR